LICGDGGLDDRFDGDAMFCGGGTAIFKLRCGVEYFAVSGAYFDANVAVGRGQGGVGAVEAGAALLVDADAEGAGLAEEETLERGGVGVVGEDGDESAEATLLHLDRGTHDVESSLLEGGFRDMGDDLWAEIVECGFENGYGVGVFRRFVGVADVETENVGKVLWVAGPGPISDLVDTHGGLEAEGWGEGTDEGCSCGCDQLFFDVGGVGGETAEKICCGWSGDREAAVGAVNHASTYVEG